MFSDDVCYLVVVDKSINQLIFLHVFRSLQRDNAVSISVETVFVEASVLGYSRENGVPPAVKIALSLLAVGITDIVGCQLFYSTLVFPHLCSDELYTYFCEQILIIYFLASNTRPFNHTVFIQVYFVGSRG